MRNPYTTGGMITDPKMFFGREDIVRKITMRLAKMQSTSFVGQRRIGKSSLLYHLAHHVPLPQDRCLVLVHVDMHDSRFHTAADFFTSVLAALNEQASNIFKFGSVTTSATFADAIDRLNQAGISPVLLLDEFEEFAHHPDQFNDEFFEQLRAVGQASKVAFVTASQHSLEELTHQGNLTSPFYNIFAQENLGLLEKDAARRLVREPMVQENLKPDKAAVDLALELGGRHPFYLQMACECLFDALERGSLDTDDVRRKFVTQAEPHFAGLWKHLTDTERAALRWITGDVPVAQPVRVMEALERRGVIECHNETWQIFSQAFARTVHEERLPLEESRPPVPPQPVQPAKPQLLTPLTITQQITPPLYAYTLVALASVIVSALVSLLLPPDKFWQTFVMLSVVLLFALVGVGKLGGPDFVKWLGGVLRLWR